MKRMTEPSIQHMTFEEVLQKHGAFIYTNVGYSMMPLLRQRKDLIEIRRKESGRCRKYDVVLYKREDSYILHRILKVLPEGYIIAGDHNIFIDKAVSDDMILGVMTRIIRNGKSITPNNIWYRIYVHLWCDCYPLRMTILKGKRKVWRMLNMAKNKILHRSWNNKGDYEQQSKEA